jgi:purine-binding chemotaxis protein CheW
MSNVAQTLPENSLADGYHEAGGEQYLTFDLAGEIYGVDILRVMEIRGWQGATRVPNQPEFMKGVINLRGAIVPVFDLRQRFDLGWRDYTEDTVIIVLRVQHGAQTRVMGIVVDAVNDVLNATRQDIRSTPDFGARLDTRFISGLASAGASMIVLVDVDRLLHMDEAGEVLH